MRDTKGRFVKGFRSSPGTEFKKGNIPEKPFEEGHKGYWNGKKFSKEHCENIAESKKGTKNNWKGGIRRHNGYVYIYSPDHPFCDCNKVVKRSRLTMEKSIGRHLTRKEVVHHINGIKDDDRIENLKLFSNNGEHNKEHKPKGSYWGANKHLEKLT